MSTTQWMLYLAGAAVLAGLALALYARREPGGRRRMLPAALRAATLALALLLVFDPHVPGIAGDGRDRTVVLLDDSWSMELPAASAPTAADEPSRWDEAIAIARALDVERVTLLSGASLPVEALERRAPAASESRLAPALRAALESGARRVVLITDGAIGDVDASARLLALAGASLHVEAVGGVGGGRDSVRGRFVGNAAVAAIDAPRVAAAGDTVAVRVDVAALGMEGDSLRVALEVGGAMAAEAGVMAPADGRTATVDLRMVVPPAAADSQLVATARVSRVGGGSGDDFEADDARPFMLDVQARPRAIVLLSLRADWEPRFLLPVLERSSGLPVRGYIRTAGGTYLGIGSGARVARQASEAEVRTDLERAAVVVLHGVGSAMPGWVRERLVHPRLLVFPAAGAAEPGSLPAPLDAAGGAAEAGDWYVEEQPPASPVAALMAQIPTAELPPLTSLRAATVRPGTWAPLVGRRDRRGAPRALALAGTAGDRRWVVATGTGYWRWALRGGDARRGYGLFWSSLVGWLTADLGADAGRPIEPTPRVVERGERVAWQVAGVADSLRVQVAVVAAVADSLRVHATQDADTIVPVGGDRLARTRPLAPGSYRFDASAGELRGAGRLVVAAWSPEMVRPSRDLSSLSSDAATVDGGTRARRRLHASAWPWLLLVGLLCGEWIARRRAGLR